MAIQVTIVKLLPKVGETALHKDKKVNRYHPPKFTDQKKNSWVRVGHTIINGPVMFKGREARGLDSIAIISQSFRECEIKSLNAVNYRERVWFDTFIDTLVPSQPNGIESKQGQPNPRRAIGS